jgi:hypothetical protein
MIVVTAQPDEPLFAWQTEVQLFNYQDLGLDLSKVHILVGVKESSDSISMMERWATIQKKYPSANFHFEKDDKQRRYAPSIRPFLIKKFLEKNPKFEDEYMYYHDSDIVHSELPAFTAMEDGRWHVSKADYISWNYIDEKKSPTLMKHMLNSVGIDEETVKLKGQNVGGVQYYIYGTTPEFWQKIEQDTERMWGGYHDKFGIISNEFQQAFGRKMTGDDFQVWCADMWCIYWTALLYGVDVYVNPELDFVWPKDKLEQLDKRKIYHDSGVGDSDNQYFVKRKYRTKTPWGDDLSKLGWMDDGSASAQRFYLDIMQQIAAQYKEKGFTKDSLPLVSCLMTTYGRFECVERSVAYWLNQDYINKELVILNTAPVELELDVRLQGKGIRIVNQKTIHGTDIPYTNVGQIRADVVKLALGKYLCFWDDDDAYLPWHISQGVDYLLKTGKKAYKPAQSYWSDDAGKTFVLARNAMEASVIAETESIQIYGFKDSNGGEHVTWMQGLLSEEQLDENYEVTPFESYAYIWGDEIASHKQSGWIDDPNNFENHKKASTDFGVRPLSLYSPLRVKLFYWRIVESVKNDQLTERLRNYL